MKSPIVYILSNGNKLSIRLSDKYKGLLHFNLEKPVNGDWEIIDSGGGEYEIGAVLNKYKKQNPTKL